MKDVLDLYAEIKENYTTFKLVPPGHAFQVFKKKKLGDSTLELARKEVISCEKYIGAFLKGESFHEIIFSKTMLSDHMPNLYEKSLQQLTGEIPTSADDEEQEELAKAAVQSLGYTEDCSTSEESKRAE